MPNWWDQNQEVWMPPQQPQGQAGAGLEVGAQPQPQAAPTWTPGAKAGQAVTLLGFDPNKSSQGAAPGSKYNAASDAFRASIGQDVGWTRGSDNANAINFLKAQGFGNARMVGDDKVDFGDGQGPIDIFRSDGALVFQNTTGNPIWEGQQRARSGGSAMPTLGSLGQSPAAANYAPNQPLNTTGIDIGTQPAPNMDAYAQALQATAPQVQSYAPRTVQGPQAQMLRIPGFANGVQDFQGGPAVVGEQAPEILKTSNGATIVGQQGPQVMNLPPGSDVIPFGNGGLPPGFNPEGAQPSVGSDGRVQFSQSPLVGGPQFNGQGATLDAGGGNPAGPPLTLGSLGGQSPVTLGAGGGNPAGGPMALGGAQPAGNAAASVSGTISSGQQGGYSYNPMAAPTDYHPQPLAGPDRLNLGTINQPGAVTADQVGPGAPVGFDRVQGQTVAMPGQVSAERVQGPAALQAQQLGAAPEQRNLSLSELQTDPSYQFRLQQGLGALQNSAAARGLLHTGGTLKGLQDYAQNAASQEYAAANARNLGVQQQNFQNQATVAGANNAANAQAYGLTNQFQQQAALANQAAALQAGQFNVSTGLQAGQFNAGQQQQANLANQAAGLQAGQFNAGQAQQAALANQSANLNAAQFNAGQNFNTQQANIANQLAAYNAYQPLAQQNQQFNAAQQAAAAQNNFANQFSVNQANNAGQLGAFNANLGAELGRGNLGVAQGQLALGNRTADQNYALGLGQLALGNRQADQSYGLGLGNLGVSQGNLALNQQGQEYNQALSTFNTNYGIYQNNQNQQFNQNLALGQLGANAAANYGNQAAGLYSGQGNANAGAAINQGNAAAGALGTLGNIGQQAGYYYAGNTGVAGGQPIRQPASAIPYRG